MKEEEGGGCVPPAAGPIAQAEEGAEKASNTYEHGRPNMTALVGKEAPDFVANGYYEGKFQQFRLSDHRGKWTVLCFYPGDFTFV
jgi:peroxiredoxin (alkyl hydroperoxide reductase subunit C)